MIEHLERNHIVQLYNPQDCIIETIRTVTATFLLFNMMS